jgi:16S rRNA (cytosine967-C5)-methyltransferase
MRALIEVEDGAFAEDMLARFAPDKASDRGLAWHLCLGTLRLQGSLDRVIQPHLRQPLADLDSPVRVALRLGTFEATQSRTPARAAVHQAVEAVRAVGCGRASGLVNAVLRKTSVQTLDGSPTGNLPDWLAGRWGAHTDWLQRIQKPARIHVAGKPPSGVECEPSELRGARVKDLWRLPEGIGSITALEGFVEGHFWVMDSAAAYVADLVFDAVGAGGTVLDACAAPGGKSFRMAQCGLDVTATDREVVRLERMSENLERLQMDIPLHVHDWSTGPSSDLGLFDAVLVDAPCSALGTVRRHPEILWRRQLGDIHALSVIQRKVLRHAAEHVKPGGSLLYAVCSPEPEEGINVVESLEGWHVSGEWNSVPPLGDEDAFQAFVLQRVPT